MSDLAEFYKAWNVLKETSTGMMLTMNFDKLVQVYGEELTLPGFTEIGEGLRDEGAFSIGISSRPTKVRDEFLRQADYHVKVQSWNGHLRQGISRSRPHRNRVSWPPRLQDLPARISIWCNPKSSSAELSQPELPSPSLPRLPCSSPCYC